VQRLAGPAASPDLANVSPGWAFEVFHPAMAASVDLADPASVRRAANSRGLQDVMILVKLLSISMNLSHRKCTRALTD
jgi:hypothetical protein